MSCASLGAADVTPRGAASLLEVGETVTGWPQLGSEVTLGAATAAAAVRRLGLTGELPSGRVRFDVEEVLSGIAGPLGRRSASDGEFEHGNGIPSPTKFSDPPDSRLPDSDPIEIIVDAARLGPLGRKHPAVAVRGRRPRDPHVPGARAHDHHGRAASGKLRGHRRRALQCPCGRGLAEEPGGVPTLPRGVALPSRGDAAWWGSRRTTRSHPLAAGCGRGSANRQLGDAEPIDDEIVKMLTRGVDTGGAPSCASPSTASGSRTWRKCWGSRTVIRFLLPTLHREMVGELRVPGQDSLEEGLDVRTLELSPPEMAALELAAPSRRHGPPGRLAGRQGARRPHPGHGRLEFGAGRGHACPGPTRPGTSGAGPPWSACGSRPSCHGLAVQPVSPGVPLRRGREGLPTPRGRTSRRHALRPVAAIQRASGTSTTVSRSPCCSA